MCGSATSQIRRSCADYLHQRSVHLILIHFPTTAGSAQFCLLCCQPEPIPGTLAARKPLLTPRVPCRLPVWSRMNHLHELQDIASLPTLHRQVHVAQERVPNDRRLFLSTKFEIGAQPWVFACKGESVAKKNWTLSFSCWRAQVS